MFCTKCFNYNPEGAKVCSCCGQPLNTPDGYQPNAPQAEPQQNPGTGYQPYVPQAEPQQNPGAGYQPYVPQAEPQQNPGTGYQPYVPQAEPQQNPGTGYQPYVPQAEPQQNPGTGYQPYIPQNGPRQYYNQPVYAAQTNPHPRRVPAKGAGIASMILGIASLVFMCIIYIGLPMAIAGLITGCISSIKAKSAGAKNGMAKAGIICSAISIGLCLLVPITLALFFAADAEGVFSSMPY